MSEFDDIERGLADQLRGYQEKGASKTPHVKAPPKPREGFEIELVVHKRNPHDTEIRSYISLKAFELSAEMDARAQAKNDGYTVVKCHKARPVKVQRT